jgi:16S rRNA processing protein RimM
MRRIVARIGRAHGIRGEVSIEVRTDAPSERFVPGAVLHVAGTRTSKGRHPAGPSRPGGPAAPDAVALPDDLTVNRVRDHNGTLLLTFDEVSDRTGADALRDLLLEAEVTDSAGEDDAWYDHELVGLQATSPDGEILGTVVSMNSNTAQHLLVIRRPDGKDRLVPFVHELVPIVDPAAGRIVIDAPPGLLDDLD